MNLDTATKVELQQWETELAAQYDAYRQQGLQLDLTRGKPSSEQLALSNQLDGILAGDYVTKDNIDTRNYGGLEGIHEARQLGAEILGLRADEVFAQGNSSLTLMFLALLSAKEFGLRGKDSAWKHQGSIKFLCPVPGYDRHFTLCEQLAIDMIPVPMTRTGPDMDQVEALVQTDPAIKGIWCVPKYSNPTGVIYSDETVKRIAGLGNIASPGFCVFWDNAYAVHDLNGYTPLANIMSACREQGTEDTVIQFASTSKVTHAGSGIAFIGASAANLAGFKQCNACLSIGPDKVNQLRHLRLLPDHATLLQHMQRHADILKPRFACVLTHLNQAFGHNDMGHWEAANGGYFISFDTRPGLAKTVVKMAAELGVKLTPAGATFPYGKDPEDRNIRLAPSVPSLAQVDQAMNVFVVCVQLASVRQALAKQDSASEKIAAKAL
ncbi:MAG: aminotransferase class I/II-fold pyridoxal phosphate-dependent enzyme [Cellvibrionaceae bacterium]|nr:aminotransferase class I/II-fold pyridoxal phosphate-dependent enzyme [Cellvibrionaceae bacterium]